MKYQKKKKKLNWGEYISTLLFLATGAACGALIAHFSKKAWGEAASGGGQLIFIAALFVIFFVEIFLQLLIHEAGHLVFGLATGYKFSSFRVFSFIWVKESGKIKFRRLSIAGTGGQCLMSPPELADGKMPVLLYNLGGVFANLIASAVAVVFYFIVYDIPFLAGALMMLAAIGVGIALMNGIPMRTGTLDNDGYNALALCRSKEAQRALWIQMKIGEELTNGVRIKDMPEEWFAIPSDEAMKNSLTAAVGVFACNRMVDAGRFEEADKLMEHLLAIDSGIVGLHRNMLICDRIYIELITENRKEVLEAFLTDGQKKFMTAMGEYPSVIRTEYAYALLCEQDAAKAEKFKNQFEECAKTYPYPVDVQAERELMEIAECVDSGC